MPAINWAALGGLQGNHLEDFIATCLCRRYHPAARQTRPASGDGGVDVIRETSEGLHIWQIKQHVAPLTSDQKGKVVKSWKRFWKEYVERGHTILTYELITPWTPTDGAIKWFREKVTADAEFSTYWHGATFVDGLATDYPAIFDRFVKGDDVLNQMVTTKAMIAASPVETADASSSSMLSAIRTRELALQDLRDLVSDHYTVDYAIKTLPPGQTLDPTQLTGGVHYRVENVGNSRWTVESVVPTTAQSLELEPINFKTTFIAEPGSADEAALKDWFYWGKPPPESGLPAVTQTTGGPLADPEPREGRVSFWAVKEERSYPRLVWRSVDLPTAGSVAFDVQQVTRGLQGGGFRLVGRSESEMIHLDLRFGSTLAESSFALQIDSAGGQDPATVASELAIVDQLAAAEPNELITEPDTIMAVFRADAIPDAFPFLRQVALDLAALQPYASIPIRMPDVTKMDDEDVRFLRQLGQVYSEQPIIRSWDSCEVVVDDPERFLDPDFSKGAIVRVDSEITLSYCDPPVVLNQPMLHVLRTPTVANPDDVQAGKPVRLVPGADNRYVICLPAEEPAEAGETPTTQ